MPVHGGPLGGEFGQELGTTTGGPVRLQKECATPSILFTETMVVWGWGPWRTLGTSPVLCFAPLFS